MAFLMRRKPSVFVEMLRVERKRRGISQRKLAVLSGYRRETIARAEIGAKGLALLTLVDLAQAIGCEWALVHRKR